jgi:hypothetical protein
LEEVAVRAGHEVSMKVDDNILLIVGDPQGILDQQLRTKQICILNIIIIIITLIEFIRIYILLIFK